MATSTPAAAAAAAARDVLSNPHLLAAVLEQVGGATDLAHATAVSTMWCQEGCANGLWRAHCLKRFPHLAELLVAGADFRRLFIGQASSRPLSRFGMASVSREAAKLLFTSHEVSEVVFSFLADSTVGLKQWKEAHLGQIVKRVFAKWQAAGISEPKEKVVHLVERFFTVVNGSMELMDTAYRWSGEDALEEGFTLQQCIHDMCAPTPTPPFRPPTRDHSTPPPTRLPHLCPHASAQ